MKPLDRLIALAFEKHKKELSTFDGQRVVFEAQKEALEGAIKKRAKKDSGNVVNIRTKAKETADLADLAREL